MSGSWLELDSVGEFNVLVVVEQIGCDTCSPGALRRAIGLHVPCSLLSRPRVPGVPLSLFLDIVPLEHQSGAHPVTRSPQSLRDPCRLGGSPLVLLVPWLSAALRMSRDQESQESSLRISHVCSATAPSSFGSLMQKI